MSEYNRTFFYNSYFRTFFRRNKRMKQAERTPVKALLRICVSTRGSKRFFLRIRRFLKIVHCLKQMASRSVWENAGVLRPVLPCRAVQRNGGLYRQYSKRLCISKPDGLPDLRQARNGRLCFARWHDQLH